MTENLSHTIIVCSDKSDSVSTLIECLRDSDYRVIVANNGIEAITLYDLHRPDLLISNLVRPKLGGIAMISYLCRSYPAMKSILMTDGVEISRSLLSKQPDMPAAVCLMDKSTGAIGLVSAVHLMLLQKGRRGLKPVLRLPVSERLN